VNSQPLTSTDPYARITGRILADLEKGVRPWTKPWSAEHLGGRVSRPLRATGEAYNGINVLLLWMEATASGFVSPTWMTYRQAQQLGGQVRKGEKGAPVVYFGQLTRDSEEAEGDHGAEGAARDVRFLKSYTVFNVAQIDGLPATFDPSEPDAPALPACGRIARAETFFAATGAEVRHGGAQAYFALTEDHIQMPPFEAFRDAESYYATLGHETTHWTRTPSRLDRDFGRKRWGDEGYSREELVAEMNAAFCCASLGIVPTVRHADYISSWLEVLREDNRAVVRAASQASKAADWILGFLPETESATTRPAAQEAA
jgi:antirestriction protein ArdC